MVRVKICGIRAFEDALFAVTHGADALGFVFASGPRRIHPREVRNIIRRIPPYIQTVGVFVNQKPSHVETVRRYCGLDFVQLHGEEPPEECRELMPRVIKAVRVSDESSVRNAERYKGCVRALLFDACSEDARGGTGRTFDWDLAVRGKALGLPLILSGGLKPSNILQAIRVVRPYAVDVSSGVEKSPGEKSSPLVRRFLHQVRTEALRKIPNYHNRFGGLGIRSSK